jgi:hypothetical protein
VAVEHVLEAEVMQERGDIEHVVVDRQAVKSGPGRGEQIRPHAVVDQRWRGEPRHDLVRRTGGWCRRDRNIGQLHAEKLRRCSS